MLVLVDIGNTSLTTATYHGGRFHSFKDFTHDDFPKFVKKISTSGAKDDCLHIVISSVVPIITSTIAKKVASIPNVKIWIVGRNLPIKISHKYRNIKSLGIDRVVNIYGALRMYKTPFVIIDYGTAITFDYVSSKGIFEGGMIIPGPQIAFQSLLQRAALIPKSITLPKKADNFLGKNTYACIKSGTLEGYGAMTDELINRFKKRYGKKMRFIGTGGFLRNLKPYVKSIDIIDLKHSMKSLLILFKDSQKRSKTKKK